MKITQLIMANQGSVLYPEIKNLGLGNLSRVVKRENLDIFIPIFLQVVAKKPTSPKFQNFPLRSFLLNLDSKEMNLKKNRDQITFLFEQVFLHTDK